MSLGRVAAAIGWFVVFAGLAVAMGTSARNDWREGREKDDRAIRFYAARQWWPALLAAIMSVVGPIAVLVGE